MLAKSILALYYEYFRFCVLSSYWHVHCGKFWKKKKKKKSIALYFLLVLFISFKCDLKSIMNKIRIYRSLRGIINHLSPTSEFV